MREYRLYIWVFAYKRLQRAKNEIATAATDSFDGPDKVSTATMKT